MKNIHVLPTDKPSKLYLEEGFYKLDNLVFGSGNHHIYITSDEKIKHLDYYITKIKDSNGERNTVGQRLDTNDSDYSKCKKIILTTDPDLIKDGVQAIGDKFLEWFVKNPSCEEVKIEAIPNSSWGFDLDEPMVLGYKIITPKEEPKQETFEEVAERMYQESLRNDMDLSFHAGIRLAVEWQAEQMYSEEEVIGLLSERSHYILSQSGREEIMLTSKEWFEQHKKK